MRSDKQQVRTFGPGPLGRYRAERLERGLVDQGYSGVDSFPLYNYKDHDYPVLVGYRVVWSKEIQQ